MIQAKPNRPKAVAKFLLATVCVMMTCQAGTAEAKADLRTISQSLLEFEANVNWAAVDKTWAKKRPAWTSSVAHVGSPQELGGKIIELESAMGWGSVNESWRKQRPSWVERTSDSETPGDAATSLLQLESVTKWEAMQTAWKQKRAAWFGRLKQATR